MWDILKNVQKTIVCFNKNMISYNENQAENDR